MKYSNMIKQLLDRLIIKEGKNYKNDSMLGSLRELINYPRIKKFLENSLRSYQNWCYKNVKYV